MFESASAETVEMRRENEALFDSTNVEARSLHQLFNSNEAALIVADASGLKRQMFMTLFTPVCRSANRIAADTE